MDTLSIQSFSANVPFRQPIVIIHYISMVIAFLGCYPLLLTQQIRRYKPYIIGACLFFASIGFISGYLINHKETAITITLCLLLLLFLFQCTLSFRSKFISNIPKWVELVTGWMILLIALCYLTLAGVVFTESCMEDTIKSQCYLPVIMGTGFLLYGTFILLHLLAIISLPRPSTPEYYEGLILTFWGFISLIISGTPILGSEWRAINLGVLWFTGGLFSISLSIQTWLPPLRERNIINALIICLTGRAIVRGITQVKDTYAEEVHTMLGYILIIGAVARITQIIFRKSPIDNLPTGIFQQTDATTEDNIIEEESDTNRNTKCKHKLLFASITLVSGLLTCFLSIGGGMLFMGASVGWIRYMRYYMKDPSTYVNIILGISFLWCVYIFGLCSIYKVLKMKNALNQYEYVQLESQVTRQDEIITDSPTGSMENLAPIESELSITMDKEKTIRPSEYRAKRRSLLIQQSPTQSKNKSNNRSSTYGVGGILPDESQGFRRSWLSSSSSIGYSVDSSSAPNSPPILDINKFHIPTTSFEQEVPKRWSQ